ncbi:hypothetical protein CTI12_AA240430 [Artemisia annua]|uniref:Uncharacterized protein n=1 Tax=Artemisia annua TaxID=35608 RepID=A0A2U1NQF0_ARTAN|nr:hypothetical protein CTI12_AA240430 [Artemisia annua]
MGLHRTETVPTHDTWYGARTIKQAKKPGTTELDTVIIQDILVTATLGLSVLKAIKTGMLKMSFLQAPIRRFSFSRLGLIAFTKYEFARRNCAWDKLCDALKWYADVVGQQNDAMQWRSELLDRMANVLKRAKALEHRDNALRRANALRLRADALGRRADEYLRSAKAFGLWAKALLERVRAFSLQVDAYKPRLKFFIKSGREFYGLA